MAKVPGSKAQKLRVGEIFSLSSFGQSLLGGSCSQAFLKHSSLADPLVASSMTWGLTSKRVVG